jgi:hypothetical protein
VSAAAFTVDLAFYAVSWYQELTRYTDESSVCFEQGNTASGKTPPPARKNLLNGQNRAAGNQWNAGCAHFCPLPVCPLRL